MSTTSEIRRTFLDFFVKNGHQEVASSPLVPLNDPTLMFTNAGMVQFKNVFTGAETRPYHRATTSQKCVRAGGKHNDLDNVGYTARHHTFFEMLGNFSFGDYFKEQAIDFAWRLITEEYALPKDRLLVTVHTSDEDAAGLWRKVAGLPDERIIRIPTNDNFWAMGDTGPCGPCSEIFFDHGPKVAGGPPGSADENGDRFIEIWNLVFMQFEQLTVDQRVALPRPSIDTGMGLERVAAVLQGKHDNYDIDLMRALIEAIASAAGTDPDGPHKVSHRVIADHLRSACFLIADGVLPSNEGRGYVLRRIMRRAMRHAHMMGCVDPLMFKLVPALNREMADQFPELNRANALITETLKLEETRFKQMLDRGLKLLAEETGDLASGDSLPGPVAFKLYDTYGFPLDLTQDALRPRGIGVDTAGFDAAMARQREDARKSWTGSGDHATEAVWFDIRDRVGASEFLGYTSTDAEGAIVALVVDGKVVESAPADTEVAVIANQTPFYGESGGQMGDAGEIRLAEGGKVVVRDTAKKLGALHVHIGRVEGATIRVGQAARFVVDTERRDALRSHHSATHLLHEALRRRLGEHVTQKGSLVAPDRLRFDISHPKPLSAAEIRVVEDDVNREIRANAEITTQIMDPDSAIEAGAMALFGEKYGEEVRVVSMGRREPGANRPFSVELCGGTHARRTGDIGFFKIIGEGAVASGVRRIEAVTGQAAFEHIEAQDDLVSGAAQLLKVTPADLPGRIQALLDDRRRLERDLADARRKLATGGGGAAAPAVVEINGVKWVGRLLEDVPAKDLKGMVDEVKKQLGSGVVALIAVADGKASLVVGVTEDLVGRFDAVALVRAGAGAIGGKGGGGRPDMAQAGGPDGAQAGAALAAIEAALAG
ncbi:alanine--tRNA ligase [Rhodospirillum rubrum]|uniref:Alanine--tRNA ligase n=1 Tax=Rhodospirillum rubrum (strain ATCC 11170 / ATH 1.1.1 / DSM 467 / LMG 4362 / NCIMB 8255 / S1) TaxID=269796 RepID=SYA_RHORT|nr:alanine--tRNA ligase [Rhodospirillum rubrum]Q2RQI0.1 RecName: Full=Alanine--tRNA ligase; AltName: Full=Alanyl-tRNA synthetase; Short=AlaRS [Rhodospirillum rubrum ATCC 11170]ABC23615.1 alanyl-tRNA synthetase [Rhodospirillum rubrum ATCC 11170]AEO49353.1 alanyl-tRNA synthetase [Rhodospirillum rubrum F11]MBK5955290.1 alanine--tRNA ligase [Rhodospirillum rubrum]QXG79576.1 alanine--tRNA ligase [Rhodospirillum rubrum]HAQ00036.1 alanine--tRNA ligase [Rhodospirillum rubrum]